jgi:adenine/guanine/hypoxanthine permease
LIDRYFKLTENHTSVKQEMLGGLTTFVTMAYIIVVNPQILAQAGMPAEGVVFATCVSAALATLVMGLYANYPIALAPGMSLNAYFTYSVCLAMHVPWRTALAVVFCSGVLFLVLTVTRVREQIVNGMPDCLKHSTAAGIGMFIAFVGLRNAKLVVANAATFVGLGSFADRSADRLLRPWPDDGPHVAENAWRHPDRNFWYDAARNSSRDRDVAHGDSRDATSLIDFFAA